MYFSEKDGKTVADVLVTITTTSYPVHKKDNEAALLNALKSIRTEGVLDSLTVDLSGSMKITEPYEGRSYFSLYL